MCRRPAALEETRFRRQIGARTDARDQPDATIAKFDARYPDGADYVIVPAMSRDDDPAALEWLESQAATGATIIGVCAGAKVVGAAGLLDGKRATTHWYFLRELRRKHPTAVYVPDRRLVVDRGVATTTGITASMPISLTLIEAIAGRPRAEAVARDLGLARWAASHDSGAFMLTRPFASTVSATALPSGTARTWGSSCRRASTRCRWRLSPMRGRERTGRGR